jgi:hypothetical protein
MCRRVDCPRCGRPSFVGCGLHIEQVLGDVPAAARCRCREEESARNAQGAGGVQPASPGTRLAPGKPADKP